MSLEFDKITQLIYNKKIYNIYSEPNYNNNTIAIFDIDGVIFEVILSDVELIKPKENNKLVVQFQQINATIANQNKDKQMDEVQEHTQLEPFTLEDAVEEDRACLLCTHRAKCPIIIYINKLSIKTTISTRRRYFNKAKVINCKKML